MAWPPALLDGVAGQQPRAQHHRWVRRVRATRDRGDHHRAVVEHELVPSVKRCRMHVTACGARRLLALSD